MQLSQSHEFICSDLLQCGFYLIFFCPVISSISLFSLSPLFKIWKHWNQISTRVSFPVFLIFSSEKWRSVHCNPAGWYAAWHRVWHEVHTQIHTNTKCIAEHITVAQCLGLLLYFVLIYADTCQIWATSTVISQLVTSWSTVTLFVKCLISVCLESLKTTQRLHTPHG